ncbi:MAG: FHA domain-containing protein [Halioglobus sp.]|nr:FHA domain-containing protein [Halioglobus sp.]
MVDKRDITNRLAGRMGASTEESEAWLEAVLDVLQRAYAVPLENNVAELVVNAVPELAVNAVSERIVSSATMSAGEGAHIAEVLRVPILRSVTPTARLSIGEEITLDHFPFRVGRDSRKNGADGRQHGNSRYKMGSTGRKSSAYSRRRGAYSSLNSLKNFLRINERREPKGEGGVRSNELYIKDFGKAANVSREHFQIEVNEDGTYELVDRCSACGTIVDDMAIGGNFKGGRCLLKLGDSIVVGTRDSSIVFEFCLSGT